MQDNQPIVCTTARRRSRVGQTSQRERTGECRCIAMTVARRASPEYRHFSIHLCPVPMADTSTTSVRTYFQPSKQLNSDTAYSIQYVDGSFWIPFGQHSAPDEVNRTNNKARRTTNVHPPRVSSSQARQPGRLLRLNEKRLASQRAEKISGTVESPIPLFSVLQRPTRENSFSLLFPCDTIPILQVGQKQSSIDCFRGARLTKINTTQPFVSGLDGTPKLTETLRGRKQKSYGGQTRGVLRFASSWATPILQKQKEARGRWGRRLEPMHPRRLRCERMRNTLQSSFVKCSRKCNRYMIQEYALFSRVPKNTRRYIGTPRYITFPFGNLGKTTTKPRPYSSTQAPGHLPKSTPTCALTNATLNRVQTLLGLIQGHHPNAGHAHIGIPKT